MEGIMRMRKFSMLITSVSVKIQQEALLGLEKSHISKIYEACHTCYTVVQNLNMPHLLTEK